MYVTICMISDIKSFLLHSSLLQSADEGVAQEVKAALQSILTDLQKVQNSKGVEALLEKLA